MSSNAVIITYRRKITGRTAAACCWADRQNAHHEQDAYSTAAAARAAADRTIKLLAPIGVINDVAPGFSAD